jgi:hypothetical protein
MEQGHNTADAMWRAELAANSTSDRDHGTRFENNSRER